MAARVPNCFQAQLKISSVGLAFSFSFSAGISLAGIMSPPAELLLPPPLSVARPPPPFRETTRGSQNLQPARQPAVPPRIESAPAATPSTNPRLSRFP